MREGLILTSFLRQRGARRMEWNSVTIQRIRGPRNGVLHSGTLKRSILSHLKSNPTCNPRRAPFPRLVTTLSDYLLSRR